MKDKRQRMAFVWPYPMYTDPALAGALLAAASSYHLSPAVAGGHLAPGYGAAASAPYYASRYSPYGMHASPGSGALHRPHPQPAAYPAAHMLPAAPHHPALPQLHLPGLAAVPPAAAPAAPAASPPSYRGAAPSLLPQLSPAHSDASSSDCDCAPPQQGSPGQPEKLKLPAGLALAAAGQLHSIQSAFESKPLPPPPAGYAAAAQTGLPLGKPTRIEAPKLFQPYKNDISEKA